MNDLAAWLGQCIDEDEALARAATDGPWEFDGDSVDVSPSNRGPYIARFRDDVYGEGPERMAKEDGEHIARWDPHRVLVECETKRRIIADQARAFAERKAHPGDLAISGWLLATIRTIKLLALPYADRDGYRDEWKP